MAVEPATLEAGVARRSPSRGVGWRRFRAAAWLGWQIEGNWTDPLLFSLYALAKPLATGFILLALYLVGSGGSTTEPIFAWMWIGNSFFPVVTLLLMGLSWAIVDDREIYQMLKYIYASPVGLFVFLAGRAVTKAALAFVACAVLVVVGALLGITYAWSLPGALYGTAALILGFLGTFGLGLSLAGVGLILPRHSIGLNEGISALFYLVTGAVFPLDLLPAVLRLPALALPLPWWFEAMRRSLGVATPPGFLAGWGDGAVFAALAATAVLWGWGGAMLYLLSERRAKERGLLDISTNF